jgi:DNA-binding CsgD family transcriptional regulator
VLEPLPEGRQLAMAYSNLAQLEMLGQEAVASIRWARLAIGIAAALADEEILSHALNNLGSARLMSGDEGGWSDLERSLAIALRNGLQEQAARAYTNLSYQATASRQYLAAMGHLALGIAYCERHDLDSWRLYMLATRSRARFEQGDWEGASDDTAIVLQHPRTASITRVVALTVLGLIRARRGDPDAFSPLQEAKRLAEATGELQRVGPVAAALAEAAELSGRLHEAIENVRAAHGLALERGDPWQKGELALWLWRMGELRATPDDIAAPYVLEIAGDHAAAANAWQELGCPYERACLLAKAQSAEDQLQALDLLERLGAAPAAAALRKRMQSKGVRGISRGPRTSTLKDPHGLTVREAEILTLMADGLRNAAIAQRLFVSTRTVDHHVSSILAKLGAKSRSEAIAVIHARSGETG